MKKYYINVLQENISLKDAIVKYMHFSEEKSIQLINYGSVWINNKREKNRDYILNNSLVIIYYPEKPIIEYTLSKDNIKYEDEYFMIVHKEAGINSCPTPLSDIDNILYGVQKYYNENNIKYNVSPINRLDKPTEGLIFFAKNKKVEPLLHNLFRDRKIKKLYLAITPQFELKEKSLLINDPVEFKGKSYEAITKIWLYKKINEEFIFLVYPLTGRTHQIRKHFKKFLVPIKGDALYGNYSSSDKLRLICFYYKFKHPVTNKNIMVSHLEKDYDFICNSDFKIK